MNQKSKAYLKLTQLEKEGFHDLIVQESRQTTEIISEAAGDGMGASVSEIKGRIQQSTDWVKSTMWKSTPEEADEYEVQSDPIVEMPMEEFDPGKSEGDEGKDPFIYKETKEFHHLVDQLKSVYIPKPKIPSFHMKVPDSMQSRFSELINWINQTSNSRYKIDKEGDLTVIYKLRSEKEDNRPSKGSANKATTDEATTIGEDVDETKTLKSETTTQSHCLSINEASTEYMSSSGASILMQLRKGIYIKPRSTKDKRKLINLVNLKVSESQVVGILSTDPRMTLPDLLKKLLKKSNKWSLVNSIYNINEYTIKE